MEIESKTCAICLEEIDESKRIKLACSHDFCLSCISTWEKKSETCPLCRFVIKNISKTVESSGNELGHCNENNRHVLMFFLINFGKYLTNVCCEGTWSVNNGCFILSCDKKDPKSNKLTFCHCDFECIKLCIDKAYQTDHIKHIHMCVGTTFKSLFGIGSENIIDSKYDTLMNEIRIIVNDLKK